MAKVFYGNQYVGSVTVDGSKPRKYTRMQIFRYKLVKFMKRVMIWLVIINLGAWALIGAYTIGGQNNPMIIHAEKEIDMSDIMFGRKVENLKDDVITRLQACERGQYNESDGLIKYDPLVSDPSKTSLKNVPSIGTLQFKQTTVQGYYKSLYGKDITLKEAAIIALDDAKAKELAKDIIFNTKGGWTNWRNCSNRLELVKDIEIIKKIYQ